MNHPMGVVSRAEERKCFQSRHMDWPSDLYVCEQLECVGLGQSCKVGENCFCHL